MAFFEIEYHSTVLEMERRVNVIYPDADAVAPNQVTDTDIPVLYLCMEWAAMKIRGESGPILSVYCAIQI